MLSPLQESKIQRAVVGHALLVADLVAELFREPAKRDEQGKSQPDPRLPSHPADLLTEGEGQCRHAGEKKLNEHSPGQRRVAGSGRKQIKRNALLPTAALAAHSDANRRHKHQEASKLLRIAEKTHRARRSFSTLHPLAGEDSEV